MRVWLAVAFLACALPGAALAKTYALVVGIDNYQHITKLKGALNDARDIADALSARPDTEVIMLLDHEATRDAFLNAWRDIAARAGPSDQIIVTYAGHGSYEPAANPETEPEDGRDETLLLSGFDPDGPGAAQRIRDDEIAELIALTPDITVIVVLDACHSGTATRSSAFNLSYRFFEHGALKNDPLPPPPPPAPQAMDPTTAQNSIVFSAVSDAEKAPEVPIDGQIRGALSYAFASGTRGAADHNGDGTVSKGELELHIRQFVKQATDGRQKPQIWPPGARSRAIMNLNAPEPVNTAGPFTKAFDDLPVITIRSEGRFDAGALISQLTGVETITPDQDDLGTIIVNVELRELRSVHGDRLRRLSGSRDDGFVAQIQEIVDKMRGVRAIRDHQIDTSLDVWFPYGDHVYLGSDPLALAVDGRAYEYVSIFNVPSDGAVEWVYPVRRRYFPNTDFEDPPSLPRDAFLEIEVVVQPPFGADHIIVIETPEPQDAIHQVLSNYNLTSDFGAFWNDMHHALDGQTYYAVVHAYFSNEE